MCSPFTYTVYVGVLIEDRDGGTETTPNGDYPYQLHPGLTEYVIT